MNRIFHRRGYRCALTAGLVMLCGTLCSAQTLCEGPALNCAGIPYLASEESWATNLAWTPNRLPGVTFSLMNGNFCSGDTESNYRGLASWWCDPEDDANGSYEQLADDLFVSGVDMLVSKMDSAYVQGFRRFMLYVPAGNVWGTRSGGTTYGQEYIASSQWWTIHPDKRTRLINALSAWTTNPDRGGIQLEVYSSFPIAGDPTSLCLGLPMNHTYYTDTEAAIAVGRCHGQGTTTKILGCGEDCVVVPPNPMIQSDVCLFNENIRPWRDLVGI